MELYQNMWEPSGGEIKHHEIRSNAKMIPLEKDDDD
jgi:hypothetical protein